MPARKKRGNKLGFLFFEMLFRLLGLRTAYFFLYFVCPYYLLFDREAVNAALAYTTKRFPDKGLKKYLHVLNLFISQGRQLIDRYAVVSGFSGFTFQSRGFDKLESHLQDSKTGLILLTSHTGNWQLALSELNRLKRDVHLLMLDEDNQALLDSLKLREEKSKITVISTGNHLGGIIDIMNALNNGHIVSIMGDRHYGSEAVAVDFLGQTAWFPISAFTIAAAADVPIVLLKTAKTDTYRYEIDISGTIFPKYKGRKNRKKQLTPFIQHLADSLADYVEKFPYQCFLFHDIWRPPETQLREE